MAFNQTKMELKQEKKVLHKAITFLYDDKLIFGEPQTGKIVEYSKVKIERLIL